jgi:hypothetical protein
MEYGKFKTIDTALLEPGIKFTAPLFFDDGINMFAAAGTELNRFHLDAVKNWNIATVLTCGELAPDGYDDYGYIEEIEEAEELEEL